MSESESGEESPSTEELKAAQAALAALQTATKNYPLYPQNHAISIKLISSTLDSLSYHFNFAENLRIDITKEGFKYRDQPLTAAGSQADLIGPPLRRDGIEWIQFHNGLLPHELSYFIKIVNAYRNLTDEPEGDMVTCLWKENLPHITYHATEVLLETVPKFDFSQFKPRAEIKQKTLPVDKGEGETTRDNADSKQPESANSRNVHLENLIADPDSQTLTEEEKKILLQMVITEESWDNSYDIIDVLLIILEEQEVQEDFEAILNVVHAEFKDTISRGEFHHSRLLLQRLREGVDSFKYSDARARLSSFLGEISSPDTLEQLTESLAGEPNPDHDRISNLKNTLAMLPPISIGVLAPLLPDIMIIAYQRAIIDVIVFHSSQDFSVIENTIADADDSVISKLIPCLGQIKGSKSLALLRSLTQDFPLKIRLESLKTLLRRADENISNIFDLVDDPQQEIRQLLLNHLGKEQDKVSEKLMLEYLRDKQYTIRDSKHLEQCYRTLGMCGSSLCLPFLRQALMERPFIDLVTWRGSVHRRGAALALSVVEIPKAAKLLQSAAKSIFPNIRNAARRASTSMGVKS